MRLETDFFDICGVCRDQYAREIRKAEQEHKAKAAEIARDFKGERAKAENESNKVQEERNKAA